MSNRVSLPRPLCIFLMVAMALNAAGVLCAGIARYALHLPAPYNTFLLSERPGGDVRAFLPRFPLLHTAAFYQIKGTNDAVPFLYPAPVAPVYSLLYRFQHPERIFFAVMVVAILAVACGFGIFLRRHTQLNTVSTIVFLAASVLLSFPVMFELHQGNTELFIWLLVGTGVWSFLADRPQLAAVLFGVAAAMKLFPAVYLGLFLAKKQYRPVVTSLATAILVTLAALAYMGPTVGMAWHGVSNGLAYYSAHTPTVIRSEIGYDHTLFAVVKLAEHNTLHRGDISDRFDLLLRVYMVLAALAGIALFFLRIRFLPVLNQVTTLCLASILLVPVSYDYTLLHLYVPWALLVLFAIRNWDAPPHWLTVAFGLLAVATSIESEFIWKQRAVGGQIKALALLALFVLAARTPMVGVASHENERHEDAAA